MTTDQIIIGHRVLVQSGIETREHAIVKGLNGNKAIVKLSDGNIVEINPMYILKDFEK